MNFIIEELPAYRIAYMRRVGKYGIANKEVMENLKAWSKDKNLYNENSVILAIIHDNPQVVKEENCRYDACMIITNDCNIDDDAVNLGNVVGGKHAVYQVKHTVQAVQKAWIEIFPVLHSQNLQLDTNRPIMERYAVKIVANQLCEICVPILS